MSFFPTLNVKKPFGSMGRKKGNFKRRVSQTRSCFASPCRDLITIMSIGSAGLGRALVWVRSAVISAERYLKGEVNVVRIRIDIPLPTPRGKKGESGEREASSESGKKLFFRRQMIANAQDLKKFLLVVARSD